LAENADAFFDFPITAASYLEGAPALGDERLELTTATVGSETMAIWMEDNAAGGTVLCQLRPRFFSVSTTGIQDSMPTSAFVRLLFQATGDDGTGSPDEDDPLTEFTANVASFNQLAPGAIQY